MFRRLSLVTSYLLVFTCAAFAQELKLTKQSIEVDKGLIISFTFNRDISNYSQSNLSLTPTLENGTTDYPRTIPAEKPLSGQTLTFKIPFDKIANTNSIAYSVFVKDASAKPALEFTNFSANIAFIIDAEKRRVEVDKLTRELADEKTLSAKYKGDIESFTAKRQAKQIDYKGAKFASSDTIVLEYQLDVPGIVQATISGNGINPIVEKSTLGNPAIITFNGGLFADKTYTVKAEILSIVDGTTPTTVTNTSNPVTKPTINDLALTNISQKFDGNNIKLSFDANQVGVVEIRYSQKFGDFKNSKETIIGQLDSNEYGAPIGYKVIPGQNPPIILENIVPGRRYEIRIKGMNNYGKMMPEPFVDVIDIPLPLESKKIAFIENYPLTAETVAAGMTLSWKANFKPTSAAVVIKFDEGASFTQDVDVTKIGADNLISATFPVQQLSAILTDASKPANSNKKPILRAQMSDGTTMVMQDIRINFGLPTKVQVTQAKAANLITNDAARTLNGFIDEAAKPEGKIDWGKIAQTGLSIFLKILL